MNLSCFKAYDVRGRIPTELNEDLVYKTGGSYAGFVKPRRVAGGRDIRATSQTLSAALIRGLNDSGVDVEDIGLCGTEGVYFATFSAKLDGGIMVTASHNPPDYNGLKFVREGSRPISADTGLQQMRAMIEGGQLPPRALRPGKAKALDISEGYLEHLLGYVKSARLRRLKVVVNAGNGGAGLVLDQLEPRLPFEFIKMHHQPDSSFPNGVPNPMLEENRRSTVEAMRTSGADIGLAWDGDFDRCFFFDEHGGFVEGYYLVGLLAEAFLKRFPGARIVHDARLTWNTIESVRRCVGEPVMYRSAHAFIKQGMREVDAVYGGGMRAPHYLRDSTRLRRGEIPGLPWRAALGGGGTSVAQVVRVRECPFCLAGGDTHRAVRLK